ncbi:MAG: SAM-dependent methyltransferase [Gammaproteobacteria bacterium]|nr:SAM-dependent methyltransferase [Gammaproteobacteria bacterium]
MQDPADLAFPEPDEAAKAVSARLFERIREEIRSAPDARIPFSRFMGMALYASGLGYYSAGSAKFGPEGDFVTAPETSALFARCLARQIAEVLPSTEGDRLEVGAGSGALCLGVLDELERMGTVPARYFILELSADLKERQQSLLRARLPHLADRVCWLSEWPEAPWDGVIVANELLDAMPIHRVLKAGREWREICVGEDGNGLFMDQREIVDPRVRDAVNVIDGAFPDLPEGYLTEINLASGDWVRSVGGFLGRGLVLIIDYGYPRAEYYLAERTAGTLMCYYRHRGHDDPLRWIGLQDITAHVDFTALAEAAVETELDVLGFTTQAQFLLGCGILDMATADDALEQARIAHQLRTLLMPGGMGESFKVLALGRGVEAPLTGFSMRDERFRL